MRTLIRNGAAVVGDEVRKLNLLVEDDRIAWLGDGMPEADRTVDIRRPLFNQMAKLSYPILMLRPMDIELEDIFLQLTTDKGEEQ